MKKEQQYNYSNLQVFGLTFLRVLIGWHFLYEGLLKVYSPGWTAREYLVNSVGPFATIFKSMAQSEFLLSMINLMNVWGLILIGLSLFIGLLSKSAKIFGILLLLLYYLAYPPFSGLSTGINAEGSYWIVNKNLIEIAALVVLYVFPSNYITGLDRFWILTNKNAELYCKEVLDNDTF